MQQQRWNPLIDRSSSDLRLTVYVTEKNIAGLEPVPRDFRTTQIICETNSLFINAAGGDCFYPRHGKSATIPVLSRRKPVAQ